MSKARRSSVRPEELGLTIGQLAAKLKAGLSLSQSLYALSVESKNASLAAVLKDLKVGVDPSTPTKNTG